MEKITYLTNFYIGKINYYSGIIFCPSCYLMLLATLYILLLTLSLRRSLSYRIQSTDLQSIDRDLCHKRVLIGILEHSIGIFSVGIANISIECHSKYILADAYMCYGNISRKKHKVQM